MSDDPSRTDGARHDDTPGDAATGDTAPRDAEPQDAAPRDTAQAVPVEDPQQLLAQHVLDTLRSGLRRQRALAERAFAQLEAADWHARLDVEGNSVAVVTRHLAGNLRSRWTDFLTTDGDKPDRDRDAEFAIDEAPPEALMALWDEGWDVALESLDALEPGDLARTVTIRGEPHSVVQAIVRSLDHTAQHVGQIVFLAKHLRGDAWQPLSIPTPRRGR
jgi:hypothetical protein